MLSQVTLACKFSATNLALVTRAIRAMNCSHMFTQVALMHELLEANLALVFGTISAMNSCQVPVEVAILSKLPVANLALVSSVRMLRSWRRSDVALGVRSVVVSADR